MRRKGERSKQGQTNKQGKATQHTQGSEKTASGEISLPWVRLETASGGTRTHDTLYSRQSALPTELPRQLSWLGPNLTSHSTPDEQANHQLSMKEKAGIMNMYINFLNLQLYTLLPRPYYSPTKTVHLHV